MDVVGGGESEKGSSFGNEQTRQDEGLESRESAEMGGQQQITWYDVVSSFSTDGRQRLLESRVSSSACDSSDDTRIAFVERDKI